MDNFKEMIQSQDFIDMSTESFNRHDTNQSGFIEFGELRECLVEINQELESMGHGLLINILFV